MECLRVEWVGFASGSMSYAEVMDFAAPYGVFSVALGYDPELDALLIADAMRPVEAQAGFTVLSNYSFQDCPAMDAFLIAGGFGTRQKVDNRRLHEFIVACPFLLLTSVFTAGGITSGMEMGFHLLRRRVMEYTPAYQLYQGDIEFAEGGERGGLEVTRKPA